MVTAFSSARLGRYGTVYEAEDPVQKKRVALKLVSAHTATRRKLCSSVAKDCWPVA